MLRYQRVNAESTLSHAQASWRFAPMAFGSLSGHDKNAAKQPNGHDNMLPFVAAIHSLECPKGSQFDSRNK
jgi:hypothetical protein